MADEEERLAAVAHRLHPARRASSEIAVARTENLVEDQYLRIDRSGYRKRQTRAHPGAVGFERLIDKGTEVGEVDNIVDLLGDLPWIDTLDQQIEFYVLESGLVGIPRRH